MLKITVNPGAYLPDTFWSQVRFVRKKNLMTIIRAFSIYRTQSGAPWELVILGDGEERSTLEATISELQLGEVVHLKGFQSYDRLPAFYALAGALVHASVIEQWGLVVNEAMACGLPVIVSERCGCVPDLVQHGVNGFRFDPLNTQRLADLMSCVASLHDGRIHMGRQSSDIISLWTPDVHAKNLLRAAEYAAESGSTALSALDNAILHGLLARGSGKGA